jgi:hypothetical protein
MLLWLENEWIEWKGSDEENAVFISREWVREKKEEGEEAKRARKKESQTKATIRKKLFPLFFVSLLPLALTSPSSPPPLSHLPHTLVIRFWRVRGKRKRFHFIFRNNSWCVIKRRKVIRRNCA